MDLLGMADPGFISADAVTVFAFSIIKILAYGALGVVAYGLLLSGLCDLFECRKWRRAQGRSEFRQLMP